MCLEFINSTIKNELNNLIDVKRSHYLNMDLIAEFVSTVTTFENEWLQNIGDNQTYNNAYLSIIADSEYAEFQMLFQVNADSSILSPFGGIKGINDATPFITGFRNLLIQTQCQPMLIELVADCFIITNVIEYEDGVRNVFMCMWVDDEAWWVIFDGPRFIYDDANYNDIENNNSGNEILTINPVIFNVITSEEYIIEMENINTDSINNNINTDSVNNDNIQNNIATITINKVIEISILYRTWYELFGDIGNTTTQ